MSSYAYTPTSVPIAYSDWPTLQTLINSGKRAVNFLAQNADISAVPYLLDEFTNIWETPYGVSGVAGGSDDLTDPSERLQETNPDFPCTVDRVTGASEGKMVGCFSLHYESVSLTSLSSTVPRQPLPRQERHPSRPIDPSSRDG